MIGYEENYVEAMLLYVKCNEKLLGFNETHITALDKTDIFYRISYQLPTLYDVNGRILSSSSLKSITFLEKALLPYYRKLKLKRICNNL